MNANSRKRVVNDIRRQLRVIKWWASWLLAPYYLAVSLWPWARRSPACHSAALIWVFALSVVVMGILHGCDDAPLRIARVSAVVAPDKEASRARYGDGQDWAGPAPAYALLLRAYFPLIPGDDDG